MERARKSVPQAQIVTLHNFLADPALDALYEQLTAKPDTEQVQPEGQSVAQKAESVHGQSAAQRAESTQGQAENAQSEVPEADQRQILVRDGVKLNQSPVSKEEAIQAAGELLAGLGYVDRSYVDAMQERERRVSTYMGMGVAIPHGTSEAKNTVRKTGIVLIQYPEGVDFGDEKAQLVFGIAGIGDEHLELLGKICEMLEDEEILETLKTTDNVDWILERLN